MFAKVVAYVAGLCVAAAVLAVPAGAVSRVSDAAPCVVTVGVPDSSDRGVRSDVKKAVRAWNEVASGYRLRFRVVSSESVYDAKRPASDEVDILVSSLSGKKFAKQARAVLDESFSSGVRGYAGRFLLGSLDSRGYVVLHEESGPWRVNLVIHELGHTLGVDHNSNAKSVFYSSVSSSSVFTKSDRRQIRDGSAQVIDSYCRVSSAAGGADM